jgi:hypothetical protein
VSVALEKLKVLAQHELEELQNTTQVQSNGLQEMAV